MASQQKWRCSKHMLSVTTDRRNIYIYIYEMWCPIYLIYIVCHHIPSCTVYYCIWVLRLLMDLAKLIPESNSYPSETHCTLRIGISHDFPQWTRGDHHDVWRGLDFPGLIPNPKMIVSGTKITPFGLGSHGNIWLFYFHWKCWQIPRSPLRLGIARDQDSKAGTLISLISSR